MVTTLSNSSERPPTSIIQRLFHQAEAIPLHDAVVSQRLILSYAQLVNVQINSMLTVYRVNLLLVSSAQMTRNIWR